MEILQATQPKPDANAAPGLANSQTTTPEASTPVVQSATPEQKPSTPSSDLLRRVSEFQQSNTPENKLPEEIDAEFFSDPKLREHINAVQDPNIKAQLLAMRKSGISGISGKMQEIAELRKRLESLEVSGNNPAKIQWTKDRIKEVVNDVGFINAAKEFNSEVSGDNLDGVDDQTKTVINKLQSEINELKQVNQKAVGNQVRAYQEQEHLRLRTKYSDYDPQVVDTITSEMLEQKRQSVTPGSSVYEDIYKANNYERNIKKAYELGRIDERNGRQENAAPASINGIQVRSSEGIAPEKGESSQSFLRRIIDKNAKLANTKNSI